MLILYLTSGQLDLLCAVTVKLEQLHILQSIKLLLKLKHNTFGGNYNIV